MIFFNSTKLYITKDSKLILNKIKFNKILHFIIKNILNNYHSAIKDGTISIITISSFMIKHVKTDVKNVLQLKKNISAIKINCKKTLNLIKILSFYNYKNFNSSFLFWWLFCVAKTSLSTKITINDSIILAKLCLIIAIRLRGISKIKSIKILTKLGGTANESFLDNCILIKTKHGCANDVYLENIRVITYSTISNKLENGILQKNIYFNDHNLEKFIKNEKGILKQKCKNIFKYGVTYLFTSSLIHDTMEEFFIKTFISTLDNCNQIDVNNLSKFLMNHDNTRSVQLFNHVIGVINLMEYVILDNYKYIIFEKISATNECTLVLRGSTKAFIKEINIMIFRIINNLIHVINDCRFLLSGCSVECKILNHLLYNVKYFQKNEKNKLMLMAMGVEEFLKHLFKNSFLNFNSLCTHLLSINIDYNNKNIYDLYYKFFLRSDKIGLCEPSKLKEQVIYFITDLY
uniref:Uncharacterized protein n=1 Tax=Lotharella oceanica TaxID=641309 RepID=A0A7S2XE57_9EUKA|mmetsp:Transcript_3302/g.6437  ORF Transcript_3302/g.6437 Transcript_3302/m.6437 type:complete len:461 (+) Transcript_3302:83-1465(+)